MPWPVCRNTRTDVSFAALDLGEVALRNAGIARQLLSGHAPARSRLPNTIPKRFQRIVGQKDRRRPFSFQMSAASARRYTARLARATSRDS
jgi:hypothetical protein